MRGKILAHEGSEEQVETISNQGRGSGRWHMREGKWPEMRGELPFKIKEEVRRQETKPHCEVRFVTFHTGISSLTCQSHS